MTDQGDLGKVEVQDLVKDGKVMKPPALAFKGGRGQASGSVTCVLLRRMGVEVTQGLIWEQRKLRKNLFSVLGPEL